MALLLKYAHFREGERETKLELDRDFEKVVGAVELHESTEHFESCRGSVPSVVCGLCVALNEYEKMLFL